MRVQYGIKSVLTTSGIVVLWASSCLADDATRNNALQNAERLAWLRNWSAALPYYRQAEREFTATGDRRNTLFAHISGIRGELQRLPLLETSQLLANELEDALVQSDTGLRLRCLVVKGDVDLDLDTELAKRDWTEAHSLAEKLGEAGWVNRAQGELAIISFLSGNHEAAALSILATILKARQIGDVGSVVRYETLVGDGLVQWKQYDRALPVPVPVAQSKPTPVPQPPVPIHQIMPRFPSKLKSLLADGLTAATASVRKFIPRR